MGPAKDINNGTFFSNCCALLTRGQLRTPYLDQMGSIIYDTTTLLKRNFDNFDFFDLYRSIFKKFENLAPKIFVKMIWKNLCFLT